jgi:hypothetical protein
MVDLKQQVEDEFKEVIGEANLGKNLYTLAEMLEKACADSAPFTRSVLTKSEKRARNKLPKEEQQKLTSAMLLFQAPCHPKVLSSVAIYRNGFLYLACAKCLNPIGHIKVSER